MFRTSFVVFVCALVSIGSTAVAGDDKKELTPFIGYRLGGDFRSDPSGQEFDVSNDVNYGLFFDIPTSDETKIEILISRQETDIATDGYLGTEHVPVDITYYHVGALYQPGLEDELQPFVGATLGATYFKPDAPDTSSATEFSFSVGGGVKVFLSDHVGFRFEGRAYGTITSGSGAVFCSGGCVFGFSGSVFWQLEANAGLIIGF